MKDLTFVASTLALLERKSLFSIDLETGLWSMKRQANFYYRDRGQP